MSREMEVKEVMRPATPRPNTTKPRISGVNNDDGPGGESNDDFREGEERR